MGAYNGIKSKSVPPIVQVAFGRVASETPRIDGAAATSADILRKIRDIFRGVG